MKRLIGSLLAAALFLPGTTAFAETNQTIDVIFDRVKLVVNGKPVEKETILINDSTYVPLRAVADMLGIEISYDGETNTAYIGEKSTSSQTSSKPESATAAKEDSSVSTGENVQSKSKTGYYKEFPNVPDLGYISNTSPEKTYNEDGIFVYVYSLEKSTSENATEWGKQLAAAGFQLEELKDGTVIFYNDKTLVSVLINQFNVLVGIKNLDSVSAEKSQKNQ